MTPILLFGANGQVGWELQRSLSVLAPVHALSHAEVDLHDTDALRAAIRANAPSAIVNAAAYTAVDKAETEMALAFAINAAAPAVMAEEAQALGIPLIHYSSDYVYDGRKAGRYVEGDATHPLSTYARSKLAGDERVLASGAQAIILRTSWVYAARGSNFVKTILRLARERDSLRVVSDQVGAPTSAELLADVTAQVLQHIYRRKKAGTGVMAECNEATASASAAVDAGAAAQGVFHCTAAGDTTWHEFALLIVSEALRLGAALKLRPENIEAIPTEQYPTPAERPKNSRLDCGKLERSFGLQMPPWQVHVQRALVELV